MRVLGIDFGEKRVGLAISDADGRIATPLATIQRRSDEDAVTEIARIARQEEVTALVVGEPRGLDGHLGNATSRTGAFAAKLSLATGLPCEMVGETLTSVEAAARLREAGVSPRRRKELIDAVAAQIVLQEALDRRRGSR